MYVIYQFPVGCYSMYIAVICMSYVRIYGSKNQTTVLPGQVLIPHANLLSSSFSLDKMVMVYLRVAQFLY